MANKYYLHLSVRDPQTAAVFSNVYTWAIFDILRIAGSQGLTAQEIHQKVEAKMHTDVSKSKTYGLLKRLYEEQWIHRYYDKVTGSNRNALTLHSGEVSFNKKFEDIVVTKEKKYFEDKLFPIFLEYLNKAQKDIAEDALAKNWLPQRKLYCKVCSMSHEAEEFFNSLLDIASVIFLESKKYAEFMKKNGYHEPHAGEEQEED